MVKSMSTAFALSKREQIGKPVAAEILSTVVNVGERLSQQLVPVYYPSGTEWVKKDLAVTGIQLMKVYFELAEVY